MIAVVRCIASQSEVGVVEGRRREACHCPGGTANSRGLEDAAPLALGNPAGKFAGRPSGWRADQELDVERCDAPALEGDEVGGDGLSMDDAPDLLLRKSRVAGDLEEGNTGLVGGADRLSLSVLDSAHPAGGRSDNFERPKLDATQYLMARSRVNRVTVLTQPLR